MNNERANKWRGLIRLLAAVTALSVWAVSVSFSVDGFSFQLPRYAWAGWVLAVAVTVIELVFNEEGLEHNLTLIAISLSAYLYDVGTNILGIWLAQGKPDLAGNPIGIVFPVVVGIFIALLPEPLFAWALIGTQYHDLLSHLFGENLPKPTKHETRLPPPQPDGREQLHIRPHSEMRGNGRRPGEGNGQLLDAP